MSDSARSLMRLLPPLPSKEARASEADVVLAARAGDRAAFRKLYDSHVDRVAGLCIRMLRSRERGIDAAQETFLVAFEKLHSLQDPALFGAWCRQVAINTCRMQMRKDRWLRFVGWDDDDNASYVPERTHVSEARMDLKRVSEVVGSLPPHQQIAWNLKHLEQEPLAAIATMTGRSLASTKRDIDAAEHEIQRRLGGAP